MPKTNKEKVREAFSLKADLSDRDIRSVRATLMGISLHKYEKTLRSIGRDDL